MIGKKMPQDETNLSISTRAVISTTWDLCGLSVTTRTAELTGNDRGMARSTASIGDNGRRLFHDGFPVGVRHIGDQHLPGPEAAHLVDARQDVHLCPKNSHKTERSD